MKVEVDFRKNSTSHKGGKALIVEFDCRPKRYGYYTEEESRMLYEHALKFPKDDLDFLEFLAGDEGFNNEDES